MSIRRRSSSEFAELVYASIENNKAADNLDYRHVPRAFDFCSQPDETFTFKVERHPSVLGNPSSSEGSSFFETVVVTYRWRNGEVGAEDSDSKGFTIGESALQSEMEMCSDGSKKELQGCETEEEAAETAEWLAANMYWFDPAVMEERGVSPFLAERYRRLCKEFFIEALLEFWRRKHDYD